MIDFNKLIAKFLKKELRSKQIGRYYPSEAGSCIRKTWYSYKKPKENEEDLVKVFEMGNMIHGFVVDVLKSEKNPEVELLEEEMPFKAPIEDFIISGRIDDLILIMLSGKKALVEVKSTSYLKYTKKANDSHAMQLQIYMHFTGVHDGIVLYIEKNTLQAKWFNIEYDKEAAEKAIDRFRKMHKALLAEKLPEAEAKLNKEMEWMCKYCSYKEECDNADLVNDINNEA